jgi:putative DNA primase/helicase
MKMKIIEQFLMNNFSVAYDSLGSNFYIEFRYIKRKIAKSIFCKYKEISQILPRVFSLNKRGWHVYFGVNPRPISKGKYEEDITKVICLFVDIDVGKGKYYSSKLDAKKAIQEFPIKPNCIVDSGTGFHIYWLLDEIVHIRSIEDRYKVKRLLSGLIKSLHADPSGRSLERVLRLPGTLNHKNSNICKIEEEK